MSEIKAVRGGALHSRIEGKGVAPLGRRLPYAPIEQGRPKILPARRLLGDKIIDVEAETLKIGLVNSVNGQSLRRGGHVQDRHARPLREHFRRSPSQSAGSAGHSVRCRFRRATARRRSCGICSTLSTSNVSKRSCKDRYRDQP